jgi:hypothetical protein
MGESNAQAAVAASCEPIHRRIDEPCAWTAADLRRDASWIYPLARTEIAEIESALAAVKRAGVPLMAMRMRHFPLPETSKRLREVSRQLEEGRGVALVRGIPVERYDLEDIERIYWGISAWLGIVVAQNTRGDHIGHVRDEGLVWGQVSSGELVRGYRTNAYMPFHSDPTDRVGLLCVQKAKAGGLSHLASSVAIYNAILAQRPEALAPLFRGFHYSLRGEAGGGIGQISEYRVPVFSWHAGKLSSRYVRKTIEQGVAVGGATLTDAERAALDFVDALAVSDELRFDMAFERGDIQYLNNYVAFHSRGAFEDDPDPAKRRHLLRMWLHSADCRPLCRELAYPHGAKSAFLSREQALAREQASIASEEPSA